MARKSKLKQEDIEYIERMLEGRKLEDIVSFLLKQAEENADFGHAIQDCLSTNKSDIESAGNRYQRAVRKVFELRRERYRGRRYAPYYDGMWTDWEAVGDEMEDLFDDIETELHAGKIAGVVPVVMEFFRQVEEKSDYYFLEEDHLYLRPAGNQAADLLLNYMKHPSVSQEEKGRTLHELKKIAESRFYVDYGVFELAGLCVLLMSVSLPADEALAQLDGILRNKKANYLLQRRAVSCKIDLLGSLGREEEAGRLIWDNLHVDEIREKELTRLCDSGQLELAVRLINKAVWYGNHYDKITLLERKLELCERMQNRDGCIAACRSMFLTLGGSFEYYEKLKKLVRETKWEFFIDKLLSQVERRDGIGYGNVDELLRIYDTEKMYDRLFSRIKEIPYERLKHLVQYASALPEKYRAETLSMYVAEMQKKAKEVSNRAVYEELAYALNQFSKLPGAKEMAESMLTEWRTVYRRRRAMMEELNRFCSFI